MPALASIFQGAALTASLIMAIGAQNAFVLRQGIARQQRLLTALTCSVCDLVLMSAGVAGMGALLARYPQLQYWMALGGAAFVLWYGLAALRKALHPGALTVTTQQGLARPGAVVLAALGFSMLNPHALLDTVVLVGGIGAQQPAAARPWFLLGAVGFSFIWFFSLALAASCLTPLFKRPGAWRVFDLLIAVMMFAIAASLLRNTL
ncbi:LysE/ArgO family amino acid transporter [Chitiniphilus purpureus]|uniref:LysE/ArgO family amino acid transporter n=1 Tax=Chitiniphilus purpureus TaxID=2981137 RepID=A0ABY6DRX2_9NEIS|nr:LysE/ArgO family amino acid transporter [Chitiniphilus sp. CD1]UXY16983.1 LysE/ArgO family amino acid transporter [Chitiniphilus sp. CD1]